MITVETMTIEQFLEVMKANAEVFPEFDALLEPQKRFLAEINIASGLAQSYFEDDKLIGVFGLRYVGIGEVWGISIPELRKDKKLTLFKTAREAFNKAVKELNLWRCFAKPTLSEKFLSLLGFNESETMMTWSRKE